MGSTARIQDPPLLSLEEFLATPKSAFGPAWRYELHDGVVVAQAGPSDRHALILGNLIGMLSAQLPEYVPGHIFRQRASARHRQGG